MQTKNIKLKARTQSNSESSLEVGTKKPEPPISAQFGGSPVQLTCWLPILRSLDSKKRFKHFFKGYNSNLTKEHGGELESRKYRLKHAHLSMMEFLIERASVNIYHQRISFPDIPLKLSEGVVVQVNRPLMQEALGRSPRSAYAHLRRLQEAGVIEITDKGNCANTVIKINPDILVVDSRKANSDYQQIKVTELPFLPTCSCQVHSNKTIRTVDNVENSPAAQSGDTSRNVPAQSLQEQDKNKAHRREPNSNGAHEKRTAPQIKGTSAENKREVPREKSIYEPENTRNEPYFDTRVRLFYELYVMIMKLIYKDVTIHPIEAMKFQMMLWEKYILPVETVYDLKRYVAEWKARVNITYHYQLTHNWQAPPPCFFFDPENRTKARFSATAPYYQRQKTALEAKKRQKQAQNDEKTVQDHVEMMAQSRDINDLTKHCEWFRRYRPHLLEKFVEEISDPNFIDAILD